MKKTYSMQVSIITPSYNQGEYLEQTIQSVLNQTYSNIEYLIIDGNSTDKSVDIIRKYNKKIDYWISESDEGQADAINKGLRKSKGELLCWINSDDILYPEYISTRVEQFEKHKDTDMIYGDVDQGPDIANKRVRKGRKTSLKRMLKFAECPIPQQSAIWRRKVIEKVGFLEKQWHVLLDREYFIRIATKCPIKYIPGPVAFFRNHMLSKSLKDKMTWAEELPIYYEAVFNNNKYGLEKYLLSSKNKCLFKIYLKCAKIYLKANDKDNAQEYLSKLKDLNYCRYIYNRYFKGF